MGHTDVVPVNPDGWSPRPVRRRADRRRGVGPGRDRHAQPHVVDGRRLQAAGATKGFQPKGDADLLRRRRRGGRRRWGAEWMVEHHWDAIARDYVLTETRRLVVGRPRRRAPRHGQRRREGSRLAAPARHRHARPRLDAVRRRQRAGQGRRGRPPPRRRTGRRRTSTTCGAAQVAAMALPDDVRAGAQSTRPHLGRRSQTPPAAVGPDVPRPDPHDDLAERRPRRPEDEHHPRRRSTSTSTSAPCPATTRDDVDAHLREALGDLADHVEIEPSCSIPTDRPNSPRGNPLWDALAHAHPGRLPRRRADPRPDRRRHRRPLLPRARRDRLRRRPVLAAR